MFHERLPFRRFDQPRDDDSDEAENPKTLRKKKAKSGSHSEQRADQCRTDETSVSCSAHQKRQAEQGEGDLREDAERNIDDHARRRRGHGRTVDRGQPRAHDVATGRCGRDKITDRFADPAHPQETLPARALLSGKKDPPRDRVEKDRHKMKRRDRRDTPTRRRDRSSDRRGALADEQDREKRRAPKTKKVDRELDFPARFHDLSAHHRGRRGMLTRNVNSRGVCASRLINAREAEPVPLPR